MKLVLQQSDLYSGYHQGVATYANILTMNDL